MNFLIELANSNAVKFALQVLILAFTSYLTAILRSKTKKIDEIASKADAVAVRVDEVHQIVNTERTVMLAEIKSLKEDIKLLMGGPGENPPTAS